MVFVNKEWEESDGIVVYSNYHRYWQNREMKIKNSYDDRYTLLLKE